VGHIVKSAVWVEHKRRTAEQNLGKPIPQNLIDVLQHIIISHHGIPEYGAIKTPATPEAIAVHYIENLDAKMNMSLTECRGEATPTDGNWTEYMKAFSSRLYRPDPAPMPESAVEAPEKPADKPADKPQKPSLNNPAFDFGKQ
jgi:3'-5' exoribonuclease